MTNQTHHYIVVGATGGMGQQIVKDLLKKNASVTLVGRDQDKLSALSAETQQPYFVTDVTDIKAVEHTFADIMAHHAGSTIDGIVHCVGNILLKPLHLATPQDWQTAVTVNLTSSIATSRAAIQCLLKTGGSIVMITAAAANVGLPYHELINACKGGVNSLVLAAAASYAANHIRINAVAPGMVETPLTQPMLDRPVTQQTALANHPLGRLGQPHDISDMVLFLLDPTHDWITGQIFTVDGGLSTLKCIHNKR